MLPALRDRTGCLLQNHGTVTYGDTLDQALRPHRPARMDVPRLAHRGLRARPHARRLLSGATAGATRREACRAYGQPRLTRRRETAGRTPDGARVPDWPLRWPPRARRDTGADAPGNSDGRGRHHGPRRRRGRGRGRPVRQRRRPQGAARPPLPTDRRLTVHATAAGPVTLTRSLASLRPGTYGLAGDGATPSSAPCSRTARTPPTPSYAAWSASPTAPWNPGDQGPAHPAGAHRRPAAPPSASTTPTSTIPGELGALPAWFVPGARDTWVITVHGLGTTREHPMVVMDFLHRHRFPVLDLAYRGDPGAPAPPDGLSHLGETEWRDLDAAIRYAVRYGARAASSCTAGPPAPPWPCTPPPTPRCATGSAASSWTPRSSTGRPPCAPSPRPAAPRAALLPLAVRAAQGRTGLHGDRLREAADPDALHGADALIFHGPDDTLAPWAPSRELAAAAPTWSPSTRSATPRTPPCGTPTRPAYEEALRRFLTPLM